MEVRVVTWNLQGSKGVDVATVAALLAEMTHGADVAVVGLQEVRRRQARRLASALMSSWENSHHFWALKHLPWGPVWWRAEGMAVLSSHPIAHRSTVRLTDGARLWSYRRRILQVAQVSLGPDRQLHVFNTHLASSSEEAARHAQANRVASTIVEHRVDRAAEVLIGDMNAPDEPETFRPFGAIGLRDVWSEAGVGDGFTNPPDAPYQRLDYVLVSSELAPLAAEVGVNRSIAWSTLSDHLPVRARFRLP